MATFKESLNVILVSSKFVAFSDMLWRVMVEKIKSETFFTILF